MNTPNFGYGLISFSLLMEIERERKEREVMERSNLVKYKQM
jgi:hypothetical protein